LIALITVERAAATCAGRMQLPRSFMSFHSDREYTQAGTRGTAVVTGASAGIGRVFAERLAGQGYNLILVARRASRLEDLALELRKRYEVGVEPIAADLAASEGVDRIVEYFSVRDDITLLVNNAGTATLGNVSESKPDSLAAMINLNVVALTRLCAAALFAFRSRDRGAIVNVGSVLGFHSLPISSIYSGTKGYVLNFTLGIQQEVAGSNVKVHLAAPGAIATDLWEISGVPLSNLDPAIVMTAERAVDAILSGVALGESVILPSVESSDLLQHYEEARLALLTASQTSSPANRYSVR
jgi:short-subunit dehydrogenase